MSRSAVVVGAGVTGLTTAVCLVERGWAVRLWAAEVGAETTSGVAAAVWDPYRVDPPERVLVWAQRTYGELDTLASVPGSGINMRTALRLVPQHEPGPWWLAAIPEWRDARAGELPPGYCRAYVFTVPVIEMPVYLGWLLQRLVAAGVAVERRRLETLDEPAASADAVFNCPGVGARSLVGDPLVRAVRGQVVRVRNPGLTRVIVDEFHPDGITYIVPRSDDCVLGGTTDEDVWDRRPDAATADRIVARCASIEPRLRDAEVIGHAAGLRPVRAPVRVEREDRADGMVIHNYGHGGAGVTLSWGCARDAVTLAGTGGVPGPGEP